MPATSSFSFARKDPKEGRFCARVPKSLYLSIVKATAAERRIPKKSPRASCRFLAERCRCRETNSIADSIPRKVAAVKLEAFGAPNVDSRSGRIDSAKLEVFGGSIGGTIPRRADAFAFDALAASFRDSSPSTVEGGRDVFGASTAGSIPSRLGVPNLGAFRGHIRELFSCGGCAAGIDGLDSVEDSVPSKVVAVKLEGLAECIPDPFPFPFPFACRGGGAMKLGSIGLSIESLLP